MAADFGGIYHWSQYAASLAICTAALLSLSGLNDNLFSSGLRQHKLLIPLGMLALLAWFQSSSWPIGLVGLFSPGTADAYGRWISPLLGDAASSVGASGSVSPIDTGHVAALLTLLLPLAFATSITFHHRQRLTLLLSGLAIAGASVTLLGLYRKLDPTAELWLHTDTPTSFGGFVNRNNAALMLNLGFAASLGLLSWRMMALHNVEIDDPDFELNDLFSLISDRDSILAVASAVACVIGILVNGSRGGVIAMLFGLVFAFGYVRPRHGKVGVLVLLVVLGISVTLLTVPMKLTFESLSRLEVFAGQAETIQNDGRLNHWQDGWEAAKAYFPLGSGISTYGYAYLPFQNKSSGSWYLHADNLWLEMLVETGIVGITVSLTILVMLGFALSRLSESSDPLDQGIRVATWYALGAVGASQFFDFGLILPANLLAALMLAVAVISREVSVGRAAYDITQAVQAAHAAEAIGVTKPSSNLSPRIRTISGTGGRLRALFGPVCVAVVIALWTIPSLNRLRQDAEVESMVRLIEHNKNRIRLSPERLESLESDLVRVREQRAYPAVSNWLTQVRFDQANLNETLEHRPNSLEEAGTILASVSKTLRTISYPPPNLNRPVPTLNSYQNYEQAKASALASLAVCPLDPRPRAFLAELVPIGLKPDPGLEAMEQLAVFYSGEPGRMLTLGKMAVRYEDYTLAARTLRHAIELQPWRTAEVVQLVKETSDLGLIETIPDDSAAQLKAAEAVLKWDSPDRQFLAASISRIRCDKKDSLAQRAQCQAILAEIHFYLDEQDEAIKSYQEAIRLAPDQAEYRLKLISHLRRLQRLDEALGEARRGRQVIPQNLQFQAVIEAMAKAELDRLVKPEEGEPILSIPDLSPFLK